MERHDPITGIYVAEDIARNLFDEIGIGQFRCQQGHIVLQLRADRVQTFDLKIQKCRALLQLGAGLEAVAAVAGMIGEIGRRSQTGKQHQRLSYETRKRALLGLISPHMEGLTQHDETRLQRTTREIEATLAAQT